MADRLWRILGLTKKKEGVEVGGEAGEGEEPLECVVVEKTGSLSDIKKTFLNKCKPGRKRSRSETCLQARAPLCGGESNISLYSINSRKHQLHLQPTSTSSQSMLVGILKKNNNLRETQSCEILDQNLPVKPEPLVRKTVSMASSARIKDDTNILRNIKKREVMNALKLNRNSLSLSGNGLSNKKSDSKLKINFDIKYKDKSGKSFEPHWKDSQFIDELLDWHNLLRARHGVKQLQLDYQLCKMAQNWANFLAHTNEFHYQNPREYGENLLLWPLPILPPSSLAMKCPDVTGRYVATYWYRSHSTFPYQADPDVLQSYASAFTQLVWAATTSFGCGKARSSNGKVIVVAYYYPRGNVPDKYHLNVVQPRETLENV